MSDKFLDIFRKNGGVRHPLHPTLVALSIVLYYDKDLGKINQFHPKLENHDYYVKNAEFPSDISDLLPLVADRWWEHLGEPY